MVVAKGENSSQQTVKTAQEELSTTSGNNSEINNNNNKNTNDRNAKKDKKDKKDKNDKNDKNDRNDEEPVEVDEFGRMLRRDRDNRQREEEYNHSDHSDHDHNKFESRRYSSSSRSSRRKLSDDHYEPSSSSNISRSSHYYHRKYHLDRYVPRRSSQSKLSDSEENNRSDDNERYHKERKRSRTWSRRSSDSDEDDKRLSGRPRYNSGEREHRRSHDDPYIAASRYIDTEFYPKKIFVGELREVTERELHNAFERFGDIENIDWLPEKGIAFIDFDTEENADEARRKMNGALLGSSYIQVNRAKRPERNVNGFGNMPWSDADGVEARKNDLKSINYELKGLHKLSENNTSKNSEFSSSVTNVSSPSFPQPNSLDPRNQIPKRKIIAYDDL
ncbi:hypothetical protein Glove_441g108 [Diversispora epigaea]|uniref:RRM domain-containing protein n=1 Tax=Diversispora epigaea TaxID=1348612 RepID=A0A397GV11_9GLOM|nr:hypothetical protein Glove_441g108 [Diversispora epigaea]